jgi:Transglycosylase SLT domain
VSSTEPVLTAPTWMRDRDGFQNPTRHNWIPKEVSRLLFLRGFNATFTMTTLTVAAALALAAQCAPGLDPAMLVGIARHESGLDTAAVHVNASGSRDVGLLQINSTNFAWLGLTAETALDPCVSMRAGAAVIQAYSRYNTCSPTRGIGYAQAVTASVSAVRGVPPATPPPAPTLHLHDQISTFGR